MSNFLRRVAASSARMVGLRASQLYPSPSKFFLLRKLLKCLDDSAGMSIGLDVACADFKYRDLFKTDRYVGIDLDAANLQRGLALRARPSDVGILANLLNLEQLPGVADLVVSTHTLASLPGELQEKGVKVLAEAVLPNGTLFLNMPTVSDTEALHRFLCERFGVVNRTVYGTSLFMKIEDFFAYRTGSKNPLILAALGGAIVVCYLLSFLEDIAPVRRNGVSTIYWCRNRKSPEADSRLRSLKELALES